MPATGNHEDSGAALGAFFPALPGTPEQNLESGVYYSYDSNNIHVIVLNTNDIAGDKLGKEQLEWLKRDARQSSADWKIVVLHKALYSNSSHFDDADVTGLRAQLGELFAQLGIDLVIQGHDHAYLRTGVLANNQLVPTQTQSLRFNGRSYEAMLDAQGTVYTIAGTSGVKIYETKATAQTDALFPPAQKLVTLEGPVFAAYHIVGNTLYYDAYMLKENSLHRIDSFALVKSALPVYVPPQKAPPPAAATVQPAAVAGGTGVTQPLPTPTTLGKAATVGGAANANPNTRDENGVSFLLWLCLMCGSAGGVVAVVAVVVTGRRRQARVR
jgi:hypothetical protein